jgi:hypothetical protein
MQHLERDTRAMWLDVGTLLCVGVVWWWVMLCRRLDMGVKAS